MGARDSIAEVEQVHLNPAPVTTAAATAACTAYHSSTTWQGVHRVVATIHLVPCYSAVIVTRLSTVRD